MRLWTTPENLKSRLRIGLLAAAGAVALPGPVTAQVVANGDFDLSLNARMVSDGCYAGDSCTFGLAITNFGPDPFPGPLRLRGRFDGDVPAILTGIGPAGWTCNQDGRDTYCTYRAGGLGPSRTVILETAYELPTGLPVDDIAYCASIEWRGAVRDEPSVADIQRALAASGYDPGPVDGVPGYGTRNAIAAFQADNGLDVTGWPTPEFTGLLFAGAAASGDAQPGNDRSCAGGGVEADPPRQLIPELDDRDGYDMAPDDTEPDDRDGYDMAPDDRLQESQEPRQLVPEPDDRDGYDMAPDDRLQESQEPRQLGPVEQEPLPRIHTPAPEDLEPAPAPDDSEPEPALEDTGPEPAPDDTEAAPEPGRGPGRGDDEAPSRPAAPSVAPAPLHGKQTSEFHRKQLSTQHDKATSGAVVERQSLDPVTPGEPASHDDPMEQFHQKYKSVQHNKETSTLQDVHTKAISRVVHSKARSVITNPQFQGDSHDKGLSAFHKKFRSQSHDTATSQARGGESQ